MTNTLFSAYIAYVIYIVYSTSVPKADTTNPENHISEQDPNILNLMVSQYDCANQNNLRQFSLLIVQPCKQALSDIQHTKTQATVYVRAKAKRIKAFKCEAYIKIEKVWCPQTFSSSRRYDLLTQYDEIFVTYFDGFDMNNGQPKPHSIRHQKISGKIQFDTSDQKYIFPALKISNNFATLDYDAHINTKIDLTKNHVYKSMTVQELNTLHTVCQIERTQLLTILAMSVKNSQLAGFLLTGNRSNLPMLKDLQHNCMIALILNHLYTEQINALIEFPYTIEKL